MLSSVSPVMTGADAASPQPTSPVSLSMRTSTLSARRTSSPAMMTGLRIGRLIAIGSTVLICTPIIPAFLPTRPPSSRWRARSIRRWPILEPLHVGLLDDALEHVDFLGHTRPGIFGAFRTHLETALEEHLFHFRSTENLQYFSFEPLDCLGRRLGRCQHDGI